MNCDNILVQRHAKKPDLGFFNIWPKVRNSILKESFLNQKLQVLSFFAVFSLKTVNLEWFLIIFNCVKNQSTLPIGI